MSDMLNSLYLGEITSGDLGRPEELGVLWSTSPAYFFKDKYPKRSEDTVILCRPKPGCPRYADLGLCLPLTGLKALPKISFKLCDVSGTHEGKVRIRGSPHVQETDSGPIIWFRLRVEEFPSDLFKEGFLAVTYDEDLPPVVTKCEFRAEAPRKRNKTESGPIFHDITPQMMDSGATGSPSDR